MIYTVKIEQTNDYQRRRKYIPETDSFVEKDCDSLHYVRNVYQYPYGWMTESGTPPGAHLDVMILTDKHFELGDVAQVRVIGVFIRNDGDHKLMSVLTDRDITEFDQLTDEEKDNLFKLYPYVFEGEGWFGAERAKQVIEEFFLQRRSRSAAIVVRDGKILMERVFCFGREFYTVPGGGIEIGETPEQAALRELKEECGLDGRIIRPLAVLYRPNGSAEYSFEVEVSKEQEAITGYDPEASTENPSLKEVLWMSLNEISEKDRAFLWAYGLLTVEDFFEELKSWGDEISYPGE